jgi:hypothetical protein
VKRALPGVLFLLLPLLAQAEISFMQLSRVASMPDELQGSFRQEKYLAVIDTSLKSSGRYSYRRGESMRWQILEPIQSELLMTPQGLSSRQGDDELLRLDADTHPGAAMMGDILFALLGAQWQRLEKYFELSGNIEGQQWQAVLMPRDAIVGQLFNRVELQGADLLELVVLHEAGGDITRIYLDSELE